MDPFAVEVGTDGMATVVFAVGDALGGAPGTSGQPVPVLEPGRESRMGLASAITGTARHHAVNNSW